MRINKGDFIGRICTSHSLRDEQACESVSLVKRTRVRMALCLVLSLFFSSVSAQVVVSEEEAQALTGAPIFTHGIGYAGEVEYQGEMIPWFVLNDVYVFGNLVFKSQRQAKKYYKIAANIKKVYPIAKEIQHEIERQIHHMDSLPDKKSRDVYLKQMEKELMKQYKPRLKKTDVFARKVAHQTHRPSMQPDVLSVD